MVEGLLPRETVFLRLFTGLQCFFLAYYRYSSSFQGSYTLPGTLPPHHHQFPTYQVQIRQHKQTVDLYRILI